MLLADTSVWVDHFRNGNSTLADQLQDGQVWMHPFILGELSCGNLPQRKSTLEDLASLPAVTSASDEEVLEMIESHRLFGRGLGWIDAHLLAAARLSHCRFWTLDRRLADVARELSS